MVKPLDGFAEKLATLFATVRRAEGQLWTTTAVAEAVTAQGVPVGQSHISQLRSGKRSNPSAELVGALAAVFDVPVGYFYNTGDDPQRWQRELETVASLRRAGVHAVALRAQGLSERGLATLAKLADDIRAIEQQSRQGGEDR